MFWLVWSHGQFFIFTNWHSVICLLFFLFIYLCLFSCDSCAIQCNGILFFGTFKKKKKFLFAEEGQDEYEKDGFIVDDVDEEERADSDEERQRKKKRKKK